MGRLSSTSTVSCITTGPWLSTERSTTAFRRRNGAKTCRMTGRAIRSDGASSTLNGSLFSFYQIADSFAQDEENTSEGTLALLDRLFAIVTIQDEETGGLVWASKEEILRRRVAQEQTDIDLDAALHSPRPASATEEFDQSVNTKEGKKATTRERGNRKVMWKTESTGSDEGGPSRVSTGEEKGEAEGDEKGDLSTPLLNKLAIPDVARVEGEIGTNDSHVPPVEIPRALNTLEEGSRAHSMSMRGGNEGQSETIPSHREEEEIPQAPSAAIIPGLDEGMGPETCASSSVSSGASLSPLSPTRKELGLIHSPTPAPELGNSSLLLSSASFDGAQDDGAAPASGDGGKQKKQRKRGKPKPRPKSLSPLRAPKKVSGPREPLMRLHTSPQYSAIAVLEGKCHTPLWNRILRGPCT